MIRPPTAIRCILWAGILAATAWVGVRTGGPGTQEEEGPTVLRDIPYRSVGNRRPTLDLYLPRDGTSIPPAGVPAILLVHGGSWIGGSKSHYRDDPARNPTRLARLGMAVIAVDYLLASPGRPSWPEALEDLRDAVRWTRRNAVTYRIDPNRIAVLGQSAGGHLALMLGTSDDEPGLDGASSAVSAVVSFSGPSDLVSLARSSRSSHDPVGVLLGADAVSQPTLGGAASPALRVGPSTCRMLLFHGSDDLRVPIDQARKMAGALDRAGVPHRLVVVEGARHGFETIVESPQRTDLLPEIVAFLSGVWNVSVATPTHNATPHRASIHERQRSLTRRGP